MDFRLQGKNALILGGTRGIGRAIAETLAAEGCNIGICARNPDQVKGTVATLAATGIKATGASVDITDGKALKAWIQEAGEQLGGIDILVSNASALAIGNTEEAWRGGFDIDIMGAQRSVDAALPSLEAAAENNGDAAILFVSSVSAAETTNISAYGAIKAALIHFAKGVAKEYAPKNIRANVVSPGTVYFKGGVWNMIEENMPDVFNETLDRNPMGRMATPQDIANAAAFLVSPVSSFTTGVNLVVDGAITSRINF